MRYFLVVFLACISIFCKAQTITVTGRILESSSKSPIEFATVWVEATGSGAISDKDGHFRLEHIPASNTKLTISCLGYATQTYLIRSSKDKNPTIYLKEATLALDEVTVTARRKADDATTAYTIDRTVLDHLQSISVADAISMLPGERTSTTYKLTESQSIAIRGGNSSELGNSSFGTAVEVDGVRLSGNATQGMSGTDLRNIGSNHIESIEVITGVPSVEYGDITNGMVKVKTFKGKTPFLFEASARPHTQVYSLSKGFDLGAHRGMLNTSYERARSVSDLASPYTSYVRNALTLKYSNTFLTARHKQVDFDVNLSGNIGGLNSESDPDAFNNTYQKSRDNALRGSISATYLANSAWLSNLSAGLSFSYADKLSEVRTRQSMASTYPSIHSMEEGYFVGEKYEDNPYADITLLPVGYWYQTAFTDSKPLTYNAYLKARWAHRFGRISNNLLLGGELKGDGNSGEGVYYENRLTTSDWREYRYSELPFTHNLALYAENEIKVQFPASRLSVKFGLRSDMTFIKESAYGTVSSLSPRLNTSYTFAEQKDGWLQGITLRAGWGKAVKLPSFDILYPRTTYRDRLAFAATTTTDGTAYYAYYTHPSSLQYNKDLKWQYNIMREVGIDARFKGVKASVSFYYNTMNHPYASSGKTVYTPMEYKFTDQSALESCPIPADDRVYQIDRTTGIVTVSDKTGTYPSQQLDYTVMNDWETASISFNTSSSSRMGVEWVLDFDKIKALNTSIRLDGKYYRYKGIDEELYQSSSSLRSADGQPYQYVGYYVGGTGNYNGMITKQLNTNLTITTHIPKIRMIFSLRVEGTFINSRQNLSEYSGGTRSYILDDRDSNLPSASGGNIYEGDHYVATYPLYYVSRDDIHNLKPFMETYLWAAQNDTQLYNELSKLVMKSNSGYTFKEWKYSPYFSANLNVTKEIGKHMTVSFYANNFFDTMRKIKSYHTGTDVSLFGSGYVPTFNYGITLKLKL